MPDLGGFRFNERSARYIDARGRFVSNAAVRTAIDRRLADSAVRVRTVSEQLRAGQISVAEWQLGLRAEIKAVQTWNAAAARGGWAQLSPADLGRAGREIREQYAFLRRFAAEIRAGTQRLDGTLLRRAAMYADAGRKSFHAARQQEMELRGFDEERSVLNPADHCSECVEQARTGWQPLGEMVPIGERECRTNCRCSVAYRNSQTGETSDGGPERRAA